MSLFNTLPHFKSHKIVAAARIASAEGPYTADVRGLGKEWVVRVLNHPDSISLNTARVPEGLRPEEGYLVVYKNQDGGEYISWSPAPEFEAGNKPLDELVEPSSHMTPMEIAALLLARIQAQPDSRPKSIAITKLEECMHRLAEMPAP